MLLTGMTVQADLLARGALWEDCVFHRWIVNVGFQRSMAILAIHFLRRLMGRVGRECKNIVVAIKAGFIQDKVLSK